MHNATYAVLRFCFRACSRLRSTNISTAASFACFDCASHIFSGAIDFFLSLDIPVNTSLRCAVFDFAGRSYADDDDRR